jgi:hypothetical protein
MAIINPCTVTVVEPCGTNPAYSYTRYPCDFDDPRSGNSKGLPVIVDLQTPVRAEVVNRQRESILAIEGELGIQPSGTFTTVRDRLDSLESVLCSVWNTITTGLISPINILWNGNTIVSNVSNLNFAGSGVQVTNSGLDTALITITGGGGVGGDGYAPSHARVPVSVNGQTTFTLAHAPWNNVLVLFIGGIKQELADYTVSGTLLTWLGTPSLLTSDIIEVIYFTYLGGGGSGTATPALTVTDDGFLVQNEVSILNFTGAGITATSTGGGIVNVRVDATGTGSEMHQEVFNPSTAQTIFTLAYTPYNEQSTEMFIDGVSQAVGIDYTLSGNVVTYIGGIDLTGTEVSFKYLESITLSIEGLSSILRLDNHTDGYNIDFSGTSTATNLRAPILSTDAATRGYVDGYFGGYDFGSPVSVNEYGTQIEDEVTVINFTGSNVDVTSGGTGIVNVEITGFETVMHQELFTATAGQTTYVLSYLPLNIQATEVFISGISQSPTTDFTLFGNIVTYIGDVVIEAGDSVLIKYFQSVSMNPEYTVMHQEVFTATLGQTTFTLSDAPLSQQSTEMFIDGVSQAVGIDYTVFGDVVTYTGGVTLNGNEIVIKYFTSIVVSNVGLPAVLYSNNNTDGYDIDFGGVSTAVHLADPVEDDDAATKGYVDGYFESFLPVTLVSVDGISYDVKEVICGSGISIESYNGIAHLSVANYDKFWQNTSIPAVAMFDASEGVVASSSLVDSWADQSGCGSNATQTSTSRPGFSPGGWSDGSECLTFDGVSQYLTCNGVINKLQGTLPRTILAHLRLNTGPTFPTIFNVSGTDGITVYRSYVTYPSIYNSSAGEASIGTAAFTHGYDTLVCFCHTDGGNSSYVYIDGRKYIITNDAMGALPTSLARAAIGTTLAPGTYTPGSYASMSLKKLGVFSGLFTDQDYIQACKSVLGGKYTRIICDGNSLTAGSFGGGGNYPNVLQSIFGARNLGRFEVTNLGIGGQTTDDMITRYPTYALPAYSSTQNNIIVAWELSNQWLSTTTTGDSLAVAVAKCRDAVNRMWDYCEMARTAGFTVIVATATYRTYSGYAATCASKAIGDAGIDQLNSYVRNEWRDYADYLVDICAHPMFSNSADTSNTYIYSDGTHLSQTADDVVAGLVAVGVRKAIAKLG